MQHLEYILLIFFCAALLVTNNNADVEHTNYKDYFVGRQQRNYPYVGLADEKFLELSPISNIKHLREVTEKIAIPRVVGTKGHTQVREYIVKSLEDLNWHIELHKFHETVPIFGKLHFYNIIATLNPNAERYLVLSCHYDSKYMQDYEFIGATDSAVPCAMLLNAANVLQKELNEFHNTNVSLMLLFFDGEEAFKEWGPKDSIYGARNLVKKWKTDNFLDRIDILVLLDLIGAPDPKFYSFFMNTAAWYNNLINIEKRLSNAGLLERYANSGVAHRNIIPYFQPESIHNSWIEDDHIPFLHNDVPILHLIPMPFPSSWHTKDDNLSNIDYMTTENIGRIIRLFTMEYLYGGNRKTKTEKL